MADGATAKNIWRIVFSVKEERENRITEIARTGHRKQRSASRLPAFNAGAMNKEKSGVWQTPITAKKELSIKTEGNP